MRHQDLLRCSFKKVFTSGFELQIMDGIRHLHWLLRWLFYFQPARMQTDLPRSQHSADEIVTELRHKLSGFKCQRHMHPMHLAIRVRTFKSVHQSERPVQAMERVNSVVHWMLRRILFDEQWRMQSIVLKFTFLTNLIDFLLRLWFQFVHVKKNCVLKVWNKIRYKIINHAKDFIMLCMCMTNLQFLFNLMSRINALLLLSSLGSTSPSYGLLIFIPSLLYSLSSRR